MEYIPLARPSLDGNEASYVMDCLRSSWISSTGSFIDRFEEAAASASEVPHAISCCNGTVALHIALLALGIGPGDEVLVPSLTFIAPVNAIRYCGAKPVFVDSDRETWNISPTAIERQVTPKTRALIAVDLYGRIAPFGAIDTIARKYKLQIVEDAAEAHGARLDGKLAGSFGDIATFSFYGNKIVTCGEGGVVVTRDPELAASARIIKGQGQDPRRRYWHPVVGYNYRMTNVQAAIGLAQFERMESFLQARDEIETYYRETLSSIAGVRLRTREASDRTVCWLYSIVLETMDRSQRDQVIMEMELRGIETRPFFFPAHTLPPYAQSGGLSEDSNANWLSARGLSLPTWVGMRREHVHRIAAALKESLAVVGAQS